MEEIGAEGAHHRSEPQQFRRQKPRHRTLRQFAAGQNGKTVEIEAPVLQPRIDEHNQPAAGFESGKRGNEIISVAPYSGKCVLDVSPIDYYSQFDTPAWNGIRKPLGYFPAAQTNPRQIYGDDLEALLQLADRLDEETFWFGFGAAQNGKRSPFAASTVDFPSRGAMRSGQINEASGIVTDQRGIQFPLCFGIVDHDSAQGVEITLAKRPLPRLGRAAELFQRGVGAAGLFQAPDHLTVNFAG
jgi:hypothetical protein